MSRSPRASARRALVVATVVLFVVAGCGESDREAAFHEATDSLAAARDVVEEARGFVEKRAQVVSEAQGELAEAEQELVEAQAGLAEARDRVGLYATDDVLFRTVQMRLLEDRELEGVAIAARVEKGVVILSGSVPKAALRDRAGELAGEIPGVADVENRIDVDVSAAPPE